MQVRYKTKHYIKAHTKKKISVNNLLGIVHAVNGINVKGFTLKQGERTRPFITQLYAQLSNYFNINNTDSMHLNIKLLVTH